MDKMDTTKSAHRKRRVIAEWLILLAVLTTFGGYIAFDQYQEHLQIKSSSPLAFFISVAALVSLSVLGLYFYQQRQRAFQRIADAHVGLRIMRFNSMRMLSGGGDDGSHLAVDHRVFPEGVIVACEYSRDVAVRGE